MIVVRDLFTGLGGRGQQPGPEGGLLVTRARTHTHTHTPSVVHTLTGIRPQMPAIFTGGWHPPTSAHKHHIAHAHQHSGANTTPKPISKPTQRAGKERKIRKNPLAEIPSLPQPGGASQASVSSPQSLSFSLSFFLLVYSFRELKAHKS